MLEVVISGIHRADEDDIWGIEALEHPVQVWEAARWAQEEKLLQLFEEALKEESND